MSVEITEPVSVRELRRFVRHDIRQAELDEAHVRFATDFYYQYQENRIRAAHQLREPSEGETPSVISAIFEVNKAVEDEIKFALDRWSDKSVVGVWSKSILGVGPVLASGLLAHIDMDIAVNPSKIMRFAGLDPTVKWEKGQKRPWNARLKVLCWKLGDSFTKQSFRIFESASEDDPLTGERPYNSRAFGDGTYCRLYVERLKLERERNAAGAFSELAAATLAAKNWRGDSTTKQAYEEGRLPDGRIFLRAQRYAVKIFLSHWWAVAYEAKHNKPAPDPWIIEFGGHTTRIPIPCR